MAHFTIVGGTPLNGSVTISGRKNAALKLIAASLLSDKPVHLERVPDIGDVRVMLQMLSDMGSQIESHGTVVTPLLQLELPILLFQRSLGKNYVLL
jgi:UDP-N-acetylglucosamine 1-carboxyvinyltransferase